MMDLALCVDIGGTKTAAGVVDRHGNLLEFLSVPTPSASAEAVVGEAIALAQGLLSRVERRERVVGLSLGAPGTVDFEHGIVVYTPNLPLRNVPIKTLVESELNLPTFVDNDANLAALGEAVYGAGRAAKFIVMLTLGTGIGGGVIIDRRIYRGSFGGAGELGHMFIHSVGPGQAFDLEALASGTALVKRVQEHISAGKGSLIFELSGGSIESITGEAIAKAARLGDELALSAFKETAYWLGIGFANVANIFNPEIIIVGGGMADSSELFLEEARRVMIELAISPNGEQAKLVLAKLGNRAGVLGGAALTFGCAIPHV